MFKCVKAHDSRVHDLVGSTNRERRGVVEVNTTYVNPSAVGVHKKNINDIWVYLYLFTHNNCNFLFQILLQAFAYFPVLPDFTFGSQT